MTNEGQRIEVRYQWCEEEFLRAHRDYWRCTIRRPFRWAYYALGILLVLFGVTGLSVLVVYDDLGHVGVSAPASGFCIFGVLILLAPRAHMWILRRQFRRRADRDQVIEKTFTDDGCECKVSDLQSSKTSWQLVEKCVETPRGFLLYLAGNTMFLWVPRDGFVHSHEVPQFSELARSKVAEFCVIV